MELSLFGDPLLEIINYLTSKDILNLVASSADCVKVLKYYHFEQAVIREINRRLRNIFKDKYDDFKMEMQKNSAVISGSFILQCILCEDWKVSDIDIYVPVRDVTLTTTPGRSYTDLENFLYNNIALTELYSGQYDNTIILGTRKYASYTEKYLKEVEGGQNPNITYQINRENRLKYINTDMSPIQIIQIDCHPEEVNDFILNDFDFDIIKSNYYISDGIEYLTIVNLPNILKRETQFQISDKYRHEWDRKKKYEERGFKFTYNKDPHMYIKSSKGIIDEHFIIFEVEQLDKNEFQLLSRNFEKIDNVHHCLSELQNFTNYARMHNRYVPFGLVPFDVHFIYPDVIHLDGFHECQNEKECPIKCFFPKQKHIHMTYMKDYIFIIKND